MNLFAGLLEFHLILNHFLLCIGLISYIFVLKPLIKYRKTSFKYPFYKICISLAVFDLLGITAKIFAWICYATFYPSELWPKIYGYFFLMVPWIGVMLHQLLIAVDRWVALTHPLVSEQTVIWIVYYLATNISKIVF